MGMRGAERKGQAFYYFVFQIESLLLAIYDDQVCSQAHSVPHCRGRGDSQGHGERLDRKDNQVNTFMIDRSVPRPVPGAALARGQFEPSPVWGWHGLPM